MGATKERFIEMREEEAEREWICIMSDDVYCSLPSHIRESFKYEKATFPLMHEKLYGHDKIYTEFYMRKKTASKNLDDYLYQIREKKC